MDTQMLNVVPKKASLEDVKRYKVIDNRLHTGGI
jgi:hypothetical protein